MKKTRSRKETTKKRLTYMQARRLQVGDKLVVLATHRSRYGDFLQKNWRGVVLSKEGFYPFNYEVQWGTKPRGQASQKGSVTWASALDEDPIALRGRPQAFMTHVMDDEARTDDEPHRDPREDSIARRRGR